MTETRSTAANSSRLPLLRRGAVPCADAGARAPARASSSSAAASAARAAPARLRKADPRIAVTLVEANATYTALPHSNAVLAGLRRLQQQQFGYDQIKSAGISVALSRRHRDRPGKRER